MTDNQRMLLAVALSIAILVGYYSLIEIPQRQELTEQQRAQQTIEAVEQGDVPQADVASLPSPPGAETGTAAEAPAAMGRETALAKSPRVVIDSPTLEGSISLRGARIDDLILKKYNETVDKSSPRIELLSPLGTARPYFANFGWSAGERSQEMPNGETLWRADTKRLTPDAPVTLSWTNSQGLRFEQVISLDANYMFAVTQRVFNEGASAIALSPYGLISRTGHPDVLGFYILHEGLIGVFDETLEELDYEDVEKGEVNHNTTGGWLGITDKYWLVTLVPDQQKAVNTRFKYNPRTNPGKYQSDFLYDGTNVPAGASFEVTSRLFAGAKEVPVLDGYQDAFNIARFDRAVDFGWFYFLTKPFFYVLDYFGKNLGNFGLSILLTTVIIKLLFFPLANKSYRAMAKMKKLQPEMQRMKEQFGDDRQRLNQEMMVLYKKEGANPMSGCLPILVQIPVFFALYKVLFVTIEMRHAPFYGWIHDLSAPDPTSVLNAFGLFPWGVADLGLLSFLNIGIWPIAMGLTMVLQHQLNPQPTDPVQAKIFKLMPIIFTFLLARFPAGLVIYWTWNNFLSILQQMVIMKRAGVPIGRHGGSKPAQTKQAGTRKHETTSKRQSEPEKEDGASRSQPAPEKADGTSQREPEFEPGEDGDTSQREPEYEAKRDGRSSKRRRRSKAERRGKKSKRQGGSEAEPDIR